MFRRGTIMDPKQQIIDAILEKAPSDAAIEVELPSENRAYTLSNDGAPITLRPMTFEDEKALVSANPTEDPMNLILERCTENIRVMDLLQMDKLYLIMKLREISYGDDYDVLLICPDCKAENPTTVKLSELPVFPVPDDFTDPIKVHLKGIDKDCEVRLPRVRDTKHLEDSENILEGLWRFVVSIDGHTDKSIIHPVVEQLPLADIKRIMKAMNLPYGIQNQAKLVCSNCGGANVVDLPIGANFFDAN